MTGSHHNTGSHPDARSHLKTARSGRAVRFGLVPLALMGLAATANAGTYGELANGHAPQQVMQMPSAIIMTPSGPMAATPMNCPQCVPMTYSGGPQGVPPASLNNQTGVPMHPEWNSATPFLPFGQSANLPNQRMLRWSYGQTNNTTDPFEPRGLSTPFMFVPWSTPLSGWTNAQTWNWWRERSGALPPNW